MAAQDYEQVTYGSADGAQFGGSATDKIGFFGTTPVVQRSGSTQAALTITTGTASGFSFTTTTAFSNFVAQVEEIRATLAALGLFKGAS
jgi:hypothetical protein